MPRGSARIRRGRFSFCSARSFHQSAKKVAPIALIWTLILAFTYFNVTGATFAENVKTYDALL